jgi:hypothetical protein
MKNKLLISVAAIALIAGAGVASAQGQMKQGNSGGAQMQSPGSAHGGGAMGTTGAASSDDSKAPAGANQKMERKGGTAQQVPSRGERAGTTGQSARDNDHQKNGRDTMKNQSRGEDRSKSTTGQSTSEEKSGKSGKEMGGKEMNNRSDMRSKSGNETKSQTTGQGAAGARAATNLSTEQRTKIKTVIHEKANVKAVTNVNFSISIGTRVPRSVHLYALPVEVVEIYPAWRGYEFILVGDQIVVVDPHTFEIVAVLEA